MTEFEGVDGAAVEVEMKLLDSGIDLKDMGDFGVKDDPPWPFA